MPITHYSILVSYRDRWSVVTIDTRANQVSVPDTAGGRVCWGGTGASALDSAAAYNVAHRPGHHWASRAGAVKALARQGLRVWRDEDGDSRVDMAPATGLDLVD